MTPASPTLIRFNAIVSEIDGIYHAAAQRMGISDSVQQILYAICVLGEGCTQADVCRMGFVSKQTVHSAIRQMEHGGLLTLENGPGRSRAIRLTDAGRALMRRAALPLVEAENAVFAAWTAQERETCLRLNARYADDFRARLDALMKESDA